MRWEKGVRHQKCEAPEGPFRLLVSDPFFLALRHQKCEAPEGPFRLLVSDPFFPSGFVPKGV